VLAELGGDVRSMIAGYLIAGRLRLIAGDIAEASTYLEKTHLLLEDAQFARWQSQFERLQLELWLAQDRLRAAVNWSDKMLIDAAIEERPESEIAQLAMARVLVVKGDNDSMSRALALLDHSMRMAENESREGILIEVLALQALANWKQEHIGKALVCIERALNIAEPEGYNRLLQI
jgi:LuxR family maltose regulon positive regulatory protein